MDKEDSPAKPEPEPGVHLRGYREQLVLADQKAVDDFDKTVIAIASGALAISLTFLKDIVGTPPWKDVCFLSLSWGLLTSSLALVLISFWCSHLSLRYTIGQVDRGEFNECRKDGSLPRAGGRWAIVLSILNAAGLATLLLGIVMMLWFAHSNLEVLQ